MKQPYLWHFLTSTCLIWHCNTLLKAFFFPPVCMHVYLYTITKYTVLSLHPINVCSVLEDCLERSMTKCNWIWRRMPYRCTVRKESKHSRRCPTWHQQTWRNRSCASELRLKPQLHPFLAVRTCKTFPLFFAGGSPHYRPSKQSSPTQLLHHMKCRGIVIWDLSTSIEFFQ